MRLFFLNHNKFIKYCFTLLAISISSCNLSLAIESTHKSAKMIMPSQLKEFEYTQNYHSKNYHGIVDFGDPKARELKNKLKNTAKKKAKSPIVMTQFGDSHTAADFFTGELRSKLQEKYGDAGIGWTTPMHVDGQNHSLISWKSDHWQISSSRNINDKDYPMGGYLAEPTKNNAIIEFIPQGKEKSEDPLSIKLTVKWLKKSARITLIDDKNNQKTLYFLKNDQLNKWKTITLKIKAPFKLKANKGQVELGGVWLQKKVRSGIVLSMIGTNGAKQTIWQKWNNNWYQELTKIKNDLIILGYGTNESFEKTLNLEKYREDLLNTIKIIRKKSPNSAILILSPPDTIAKKENEQKDNDDIANLIDSITSQPVNYWQVRAIQQDVAKEAKTLYWDWQTAMGGIGTIEKWHEQDLARSDLIHLTKNGYIKCADQLYQDFMEFTKK